MPGSETKDSLTHSTAGDTSITLVPGPLLAPKSHGGDAQGARWVTHMQCIWVHTCLNLAPEIHVIFTTSDGEQICSALDGAILSLPRLFIIETSWKDILKQEGSPGFYLQGVWTWEGRKEGRLSKFTCREELVFELSWRILPCF